MLVLDHHEESDWNELPDWVRQAATALGYTEKLWDKDKEPVTCDKDWIQLDESQQEAAKRLGYTQKLWDECEKEDATMEESENYPSGNCVLDEFEDSDWKDLPEWIQQAATELGYTKKLWNKDKEPETYELDWEELSPTQKQAAMKLGYTPQLWDEDDGSKSETGLVLDDYEDADWKELPEWVREAATVLGYTKKLWNKDKEPDTCELDWEELDSAQKEAAMKLGYTPQLWDKDEEHPGVIENLPFPPLALEGIHPYPKWTVYCVQLYTETKDYQLRMREGIGIAMFTNRSFVKDERVVQSPVGPSNHKELFQATSSDECLTPERRAFAERYFQWHDTHYTKYRDGAQNSRIALRLEDFYNPPTTDPEYRDLPRPGHYNYDLEICEHEILICEFVSPNDTDYELPPDRQFEVLHYDEGLVGLHGEPGYSPSKMKRPPTACFTERRSLEVPGHFTNHVCGSSSTAYDFLKLSQDDATPEELLGRPKWIEAEFETKKKVLESKEFLEETLRVRRDLSKGEEVTTDYARWHWSHGDFAFYGRRTPIGFFYGTEAWTKDVPEEERPSRWKWEDLSPKFQWAGTVLGYTQEMWDEAKETPAVFGRTWKMLTTQEREGVFLLTGYDKETWDTREGAAAAASTEEEDDVTSEGDRDWEDFSEDQKRAASYLGYTPKTWEDEASVVDAGDGYFYNLRPEIRNALAVLGTTESTWESSDNSDGEWGEAEPWFDCMCGAPDCHSSEEKGGFRGMKYFPVEQIKILGPVCEPFVHQQINWKLYQLKEMKNKRKREIGTAEE